MTFGANAQYLAPYLAVETGKIGGSDYDRELRSENGVSIPTQVYVDVSASYRIGTAGAGLRPRLELRLGIQNLLDHRPPTVRNVDYGYSLHADPRRRRFEVSATSAF